MYSRAQHRVVVVVFVVRSVYLHFDAEHICDACHSVHEHVQQTMTLIDGPSSIQLKEKRARTGHFAVQQQLDSISPSPWHGSGAVALRKRQGQSRDWDLIDS